MSLFKAREWWVTTCGDDEDFDQASLCISNLGRSSSDLVFVGSHAGVIRVFCPSLPSAANAPGYNPKDLLIETHLSQPILHLQVGRFISGSSHLHLAVLHPLSVVVYSLVVRAGNADHGEQSALIYAYEHQLKKSAYSLIVGSFGGVRGRDFLCVQSLDGTLCFFEQETYVFSRQLPDFLLPGPLLFVASTDAFVTCTSHYCVESYRYQSLAETIDGSDKHLSAEWSLNIGESALDIVSVTHSATEVDIFILGEHNLFCIRDHGTIKFMQRFEFQPRCFHVYRTAPEGLVMVLLSTDTGTLLVFNNTTLRWSAQLPFSPVAVARGAFQGMEGVVVTLSETGLIQCCYMGTEPSLFVAPSVEPRPIDYHEAEKELNYLSNIIREFNHSSSLSMVNTAAEKELEVCVKVSQQPEYREDSPVCYVAVHLSPHSAHAPLNKVQVTIAPRLPLIADPPLHSISSLCEGHQIASYIKYKLIVPHCIWSLEVTILVSYMTGSGVPRVIHTSCQLPLLFIASPCPPIKDSEIKITLNASNPVINLLELFPAGNGSNVLGFSFGSTVVTLLAAKMSSRYRLQANSIYPLAVLIKQLLNRIKCYEKKAAGSKLPKVLVTSPLPLPQLFREIDDHMKSRMNVNKLQDELAQLSAQFRAIERRLLTKMKDKKPMPLNQLDTLLFATQEEIMSVSSCLEKSLKDLEASQWRLSCAVELVHVLLQSSNVDQNAYSTFRAAFPPHVFESEDHGWEDWIYAAMQYIFKASPANFKDDITHVTPIVLESINDASQVSKLVTSIIEGMITDTQETNDDGRKLISPINEVAELDEELSGPLVSGLAEIEGSSMQISSGNTSQANLSVLQDNKDGRTQSMISEDQMHEREDDILWI